jgi:hypothetical protein
LKVLKKIGIKNLDVDTYEIEILAATEKIVFT